MTKVVNPLGTVITVLADEDSSSQEFDDEAIAEGPRSVCAEEGPSSLTEVETEVNSLRNLTEICAEMRSASEPAIDSVPDDEIRDLKEQKQLCVEAATMSCSSIDYERSGAFRDVPTSLSLCAEQGEIPSSPMTQARETAWKRPIRDDNERNIASAKYVVNYDDESLVLMENKTAVVEVEDHIKLPQIKQKASGTFRDLPKPSETFRNLQKPAEAPKYLLHESEDSVIIEDTRPTKPISKPSEETSIPERRNRKKNSKKSPMETVGEAEAMIVERNDETLDTFVDLKGLEALNEPMEAVEVEGLKNLPLDLPFDDLNCMDYHIIEPNAEPQVSDDDIEHISSEVIELDAKIERFEKLEVVQDFEISPARQRKGSKSTISDDDLEHIQTDEITELLERAKSLAEIDEISKIVRNSKTGMSSDEEIEHVVPENVAEAINKSPEPLEVFNIEKIEKIDEIEKIEKIEPIEKSDKIEKIRSRGSRKRKDVVVIDSSPSAPEVTIVKSLGPVNPWKSKSPEQDLPEEADRENPKESASQSLPKKTRVRTPKGPIKPPNVIEIIDIDALQKAEMEMKSPECKILEPCSEMSMRLKKSRRNKKVVEEAGKVEEAECSNWETIVHRPRLEEIEGQIEVDKDVDKENKQENVEQELRNVEKVDAADVVDVKGLKKRGKKSISEISGPEVEKNFPEVGCEDIGSEKIEEIGGVGEIGELEGEKREENLSERSSSDDLNANVVPMDTEEDTGVKEVDKGNSTALPSWPTVAKKNCRSKKKKRR